MATPPTLMQSEAASSLLSLSAAAANAAPITMANESPSVGSGSSLGVHVGSLNAINSHAGVLSNSSLGNGGKHHRRLSSTGKARRRLSDARDAANRPSPPLLQSATTLSLTSLSLSSPPPVLVAQVPTPFAAAFNALRGVMDVPRSNGASATVPTSDNSQPSTTDDDSKGTDTIPIPIGHGKYGKKRGVDHKCESCSKIYRHPSCLIKHRWEHTPHWREASKFVLSKHQQVQLLEAAAILSHLSPSSSSLPEDRSLWPSFLSGGSLPKAEETSPSNNGSTNAFIVAHPISSSVPASGHFVRPTSGPRLHNYSIPSSTTGSGGITQLRPGLIGVPNPPSANNGAGAGATSSIPVPVPDSFSTYRTTAASTSWASSNSYTPSSYLSNGRSLGSLPYGHADEQTRGTGTGAAGGWSLPRSSVRGSSSESRSRSASDDESVDVDIDGEGYIGASRYPGRYGHPGWGAWKREDDEMSIGFSVREEDEDPVGERGVGKEKNKEPEWDGLEMDMDMD